MNAPVLFSGISIRQLAGLLLLGLLAGSVSSCKKKNKGGAAKAPAAPIEGADASGDNGCVASLQVVRPLPQTVPGSLNLTSADLENVKTGSFSTARLLFGLEEGSAIPDKYVYYACSATRSGDCILGSTTVGQDFNPNLPAGTINLKAWACVRPQRIRGYPDSLTAFSGSKIAVGGTDFYCGAPIVHYDKMDSNFGQESLAQIQSLIKSLEDKREQLAYRVVGIVQEHVKGQSQGLNLTSGTGSANDIPWVSLANGGDHSAAAIASLYGEALSATDDGLNRSKNSNPALNLAGGDPCIPIPDPSTINPSPAPFNPPPVKTLKVPETTVTPAVVENKLPEPVENKDAANAAVESKEAVKNVASQEDSCKVRDEWFRSQNLGSAQWDAGLNRCFHVRATGQKTEIDVSIDPASLNPPAPEEETVVDEDTGLSGWQKTGVAMMAIGGTLGVVGGGSYLGSQKISEMITKKQTSDVLKVDSEETLLKAQKTTDVITDKVKKAPGEYWGKLKKGDAGTIKKTGTTALLVGFAMFAIGGILTSGVLELSGGDAQEATDLSSGITSDPRYRQTVKDIEEINRMIGQLRSASN